MQFLHFVSFCFFISCLNDIRKFLTQSLTGKNTALDNLREKLQSLELNIKDSSEKIKIYLTYCLN